MKIKSEDKDKFFKGQELYTFYVEQHYLTTQIKDYTGIMKVRVTSNKKSQYGGNTTFKIIESKKLGSTISHNIHLYMNGYGMASCVFFDTYARCARYHDSIIKKISKHLKSADKERFYKKLINRDIIPVEQIEIDSIAFYDALNEEDQAKVRWLNSFYDFKTN